MALASQHGLDVDHEPDEQWLQIWAPKGKIFATSGCHVDASFQNLLTNSGRAHDWVACLSELRSIISHGLYDCPDGESCEVCHP